ncbi:MAG: type II toxin-antitoxin system HicA family toxin [Treponema sp.]|nr:type II toxin-antitoxin system HicA family toxin [Treponema sp.]
MTAREVLRLLRKDGWYQVAQRGSHIQLKHSKKLGKVSVANHKGDIPAGTLRSILTQAGLIGQETQ